MSITAEERLMYEVMKAIYESGIPVSFKGSMVLKACLMDAGYTEETRHTVDIDGNWNSDKPPSAVQMEDSLQKALNKGNVDLNVHLYRMFGEGRSAGFELVDNTTDEVLFTMDIDVNRPLPPTKIYEVEGLCFRGVVPIQMIADKLSVISTDKVFRRIKDVIDLYYLSKCFIFTRIEIVEALRNSGRTIGNFEGFLNKTEELKHAYDKFRFTGDVNKPPFEEIYSDVLLYLREMLSRERNQDDFER